MSDAADPHCPECGEPVLSTATDCVHCGADLSGEPATVGADDAWGRTDDASVETGGRVVGGPRGSTGPKRFSSHRVADEAEQLLDPDGLVDNSLTVVVGIVGGIVVGLIGTIALGLVTQSAWGYLLGLLVWLGATAYLVRRRTVQGAVANTGYAVAAVLLAVPVTVLSPLFEVDGGIAARGGSFVGLLLLVAVPAGIAAAIGWIASQFVPNEAGGSEG